VLRFAQRDISEFFISLLERRSPFKSSGFSIFWWKSRTFRGRKLRYRGLRAKTFMMSPSWMTE